MSNENNKLHDQAEQKEASWSRRYDEAWEEHLKWKGTALEWKAKNQTLRGRLSEAQVLLNMHVS